MKPALRGVRRALLDADVNVNVADTLIEGVKTRSLGKEVLEGVTAEQQFIKAMYDELLDMMGGDSATSVSTEQSFMPAATLAYNSDRPTVVLLGTYEDIRSLPFFTLTRIIQQCLILFSCVVNRYSWITRSR